MKKLYTLAKFSRWNLRHARRSLKARLRHRLWKQFRIRNKPKKAPYLVREPSPGQHFEKVYSRITVPTNFSMVDNPEEVIDLIQKLKALVESNHAVELVMKDVKKIGYDAVVVLLAILFQFKSKKVGFKGDFPKDPQIMKLLSDSGFFEKLNVTFQAADWLFIAGNNVKSMHTHANYKVESELGQEILKKASKVVWKEERRCQGVQRALVELMQNTNNHASEIGPGEKQWWLSVNEKPLEGKVCFSFVDFGIGVFESLKHKPSTNKWFGALRKLLKISNYKNNAELLRLILDGKLHQTVTEQPFRGKGLPGLKLVMQRNQFSKLHVITNNAFANVENDEFRVLHKVFTGTFVYWELNSSNVSSHG